MRVRVLGGAFAGLEGDARQAFGRDRYHVRFARSRGPVHAGVDYLFARREFEPI